MKSFLIAALLCFSACAPNGALNSQFRADTGPSPLVKTNPQTRLPEMRELTPSPETPVAMAKTNEKQSEKSPEKPTEKKAETPSASKTLDGPEIVVTAPKKPLPIPAWAAKPQSATWTASLIRALKTFGQDLVSTEIRDAVDFCPAYPRLAQADRTKVWVQLISAMAKYESDLKPTSAFMENFTDRGGHVIVSRGLLQISKSSANGYGCNIQNETDLENPEINLQCGVRILNALVPKYHAIHGLQEDANVSLLTNPWKGAARYWSVLRGKAKDWLIRYAVRQMPVCGA